MKPILKPTIRFSTLIVIFTVILGGCGKDGDPGPKGEKGEMGNAGPAGAQGAKGEQGEKGTANVLYSEWLTANWNFTNTNTYKVMRVEEPLCTNSFNEEGGIFLLYFRFQNNVVYQLPHSDHNNQNYKYGFPVYFENSGEIRIVIESTNGTTLTEAEALGSTHLLKFKYVLIPGGLPVSSTGRMGSPVDYSDYEAVKAYYNIPD